MRILLVDDDASLVQALLPALQSLPGQEIFSAPTGPEAMDLAAQLGVDLLVTDVVMDPLDGFSLNEELQRQYPALRTIFLTGYDLSDYADRVGSCTVLQKPIAVDDLLQAVQREAAALRPPGSPAPKAVAAIPKPTSVARATAAPAPRPTAVPKPAAIARPGGAPAARPSGVAVPKVAAVQPHVVPKPAPVAVVQPNVTTKAVPVARPGAAPAQAKAPAPVARPAGARIEMPKAAAAPPAGAPRPVGAAARPTVPPATGAPAAVSATPEEAPQDLLGQLVGGYQIVSRLGEGRWGTVYAAVQTSINRPVGLKVLDPRRARDDAQKQRFIADARAKAHVQHPSILSVYEAGAADGWIFYTHEYVDGQNLMEMYAADRTVDELTALKILRVAAEGLLYLNRNDVPHAALTSGDIYLGVDGHPRLSNIATQSADLQLTVGEEIQVLGEAVWPVLAHPVSEGLQTLLGRTQQAAPDPVTTWGPLLQGIKALEPKFVPIEAEKIGAQERAAAQAAERVRQAQRRSFYLNLASMVSLGLLAVFAIWYFLVRSNERVLEQPQIHIPAGQFLAGNGQTANNPEFWIDKYEVTIGQYAKFVEWIRAHPGDDHAYDHPRQPKQLSHVPEDWEIYYQRAVAGKPVRSIPISLNAPMMNVNWWDAYAYAKFKGRELPTELEWERAGRSTDGRAYPWGDEPDVRKANTNADHQERDPAAKGAVDGFNFWGDVDAQKSDKSPDGLVGMAGNVSEWTATWTPDNRKPILKGGNFATPLTKLGDRFPMDPIKRDESIGFRTVTHKAPEK